MKLLAFIVAVIGFGHCVVAYSPIIDGAVADVRIKVVDEEGAAVPQASVSVTFYTAPEEVEVKRGETDALGFFSAKALCIGEVHAWIRKEGYYDTKSEPAFRVLSDEDAQKSRKWSLETVETTATLKKVRTPAKLVLHSLEYRKFPATNEIVKLDLETLDWCPPYGKGRHDDVHMLFDGWRNPQDWYDFHEHLRVKFPNCVDGFYRQKADVASAFRYDYTASTNEVYGKELALQFARTRNSVTNNAGLAKDEYLVYRIRTQTNELGQVTHAHYGRIGEDMDQKIGLTIHSWFNSKDGDTNLEDAGDW